MKSKKMLAQIAAFSLVFGMTGVVSSWADEIILDGTTVKFPNDAISLVKNEDGSFTVNNQDVKGVWLQNGSKLTANHVNFINGGKGSSEISVDNRSTLTVNGGSIDSDQDAFNVNDGSKAEVNEAKVTTGAWANNAAITLKNSTTSGNWLYAGNAFPEDENDKGDVAEGLPVGSITIDGGTASVKNVLVQNKGQFTVTNGAVLDVTKDTSATDTEWSQPATGITKGGEIVVRAWGPNTAQAEKGNSDSDPVNKLDQVSTLAVNGATVKANKLTVEGKEAKELNYSESAAFMAKNSTIETNTLHFGAYGYGKLKDSQLNVKDKLLLDDMTNLHMEGGSALLNEVSLSGESQINFKGTNAAMKSVSLNNAAVLEAWDSTFQADCVNLSNEGIIEFYNGSKANVGQLTADHGVVYLFADKSQGDGTPDVTIAKMDLKNKSEINLCAGTLHSNQITMDDSTIDIAGVGTLIANKMTLNNTTLSLSGFKNNVDTRALIQPLDVTQNGVTVEVKDTLAMNGGTLQVNDGSKLITNQMKLANGSTVNVVGPGSSYTINGKENVMSGNAQIAVTGGGSVKLAEGAGIKAEADANNKVKTIITADENSTVDVTKGSLYIANAERDARSIMFLPLSRAGRKTKEMLSIKFMVTAAAR